MTAYHKRLTSDDEDVRLSAARAWSTWEGATSKLYPDQELMEHWEGEHEALSLARIECHYFMNNSFFRPRIICWKMWTRSGICRPS
jgi:proline iminopeptidase